MPPPVIIIGIPLVIGLFIGYRIGKHLVRKENTILNRQVILLQQFSEHWAAEATGRQELSRKVAEQQTTNVNATMQAVIHLLRSFQYQQSNNTNQEDRQKVEKIINQVKDNFPL